MSIKLLIKIVALLILGSATYYFIQSSRNSVPVDTLRDSGNDDIPETGAEEVRPLMLERGKENMPSSTQEDTVVRIAPVYKKLIDQYYKVDETTLEAMLEARMNGAQIIEALELAEMINVSPDELVRQLHTTRGGFHGLLKKHDIRLIQVRHHVQKRLKR
jgi:ribosomal protein L3